MRSSLVIQKNWVPFLCFLYVLHFLFFTGRVVEVTELRRSEFSPKGSVYNPLHLLLWGEPGEVADELVGSDLTIMTELGRDVARRDVFWLPINSQPSERDNEWAGADRPIRERPIDVLYRSSNCDPERERFVSVIRSAVVSSGYTFERDGRCRGGGPWLSRRYVSPDGVDPGFESKTMVAMSRIQDWGHEALDEKLILPLKYGSIPLYSGTGLRLASIAGYPPSSSWLSRSSYPTESAYVAGIIDLLGSETRMEKMRSLSLHSLPTSYNCTAVSSYASSLSLSLPSRPTVLIRSLLTPPPSHYDLDYYASILDCVIPRTLGRGGGYEFITPTDVARRGGDGGFESNIVIDQCCGIAAG